MRNTKRVFGCAVAVAALAAGGLASPAQAAPLACGDTVTASVTLTADLGPCPGAGLVVQGAGVVLNLAGHTIRGDGNPAGTPEQVGIKIDNSPGAQVINGTVRDFNGGIDVWVSPRAIVRGMTVTNNVGNPGQTHQGGVYVLVSDDAQVVGSTLSSNGPSWGINFDVTQRGVIADSKVIDNNVITPAVDGFPPSQFDVGISFGFRTLDTVIRNNQILRNGFEGVSAAGGGTGRRQVLNNVVRDNGVNGINTGGEGGDLVQGNVVDHNGYDQWAVPGIPSDFGFSGGIVTCGRCLSPGPPGTYRANQVTNNRGAGIAILFNWFQCCGQPPQDYTRAHVIEYNTVRGNTRDGIFIECDQTFAPWPFVPGVSAVSCVQAPPHVGTTIRYNSTGGNGGADAGKTAWDLHDGNADCNGQTWLHNTYVTANPACTKG